MSEAKNQNRGCRRPVRRSIRPYISLLMVLLSVALSACTAGPPTYPYEKEVNPLTAEYIIGIADELSIDVFKQREFNAGVTVRPDGKITLPVIGDVVAVDRTPSQVQAELVQRLGEYIKGGVTVTVAVTGVNSYFVTVAGQVEQPGRFTAQGYLTVSDAIALAGGPNRFAAAAESFVLRKDPNGQTRRIPVNYEQINRGEYLQQNLYLVRGDQVIVP